MGAHLIDGEFQSDKYPTCPRGKVPLSVKDPTAQDLLWYYAQRRRLIDAEFSSDLEASLRAAGYNPAAVLLSDPDLSDPDKPAADPGVEEVVDRIIGLRGRALTAFLPDYVYAGLRRDLNEMATELRDLREWKAQARAHLDENKTIYVTLLREHEVARDRIAELETTVRGERELVGELHERIEEKTTAYLRADTELRRDNAVLAKRTSLLEDHNRALTYGLVEALDLLDSGTAYCGDCDTGGKAPPALRDLAASTAQTHGELLLELVKAHVDAERFVQRSEMEAVRMNSPAFTATERADIAAVVKEAKQARDVASKALRVHLGVSEP